MPEPSDETYRAIKAIADGQLTDVWVRDGRLHIGMVGPTSEDERDIRARVPTRIDIDAIAVEWSRAELDQFRNRLDALITGLRGQIPADDVPFAWGPDYRRSCLFVRVRREVPALEQAIGENFPGGLVQIQIRPREEFREL